MSYDLPRLLPKPSSDAPPPPEPVETSGPQKQRFNVRAACTACSLKKTKCNGLRPACTPCSRSGTECSYDAEVHETKSQARKRKVQELEEKAQHLQNLYTLLQNAPDEIATEALQHIRQGMSVESVLTTMGQSLTTRSPSPNQTNRSMLPPTNTSLEFQLVAMHPNAYPSLVPLNVASIDLKLLGVTCFAIPKYGTVGASSGNPIQEPTLGHGDTSLSTTAPANYQSALPQYTSSGSSKEFTDARLKYLRISHWTDVAITDYLAAQAISLYLSADTPWWSYFDIDLFLNDLISGESKFCSQLLVNAVLAWACKGYSYYEPASYVLASKFLDECSRLYDAECGVDSLTTVAATSLMCMAWTTSGKDKIGSIWLSANANMAKRLQLYDVRPNAPPNPLDLQDEDVKVAAAATAWGSFNFQMIMSMSYRNPPLVKSPPTLPIPGDLLSKDSTGYALPPYQGSTYTFVCKLWAIAYEMNYEYYHKRDVSLVAAEVIYQKLLSWADSLEEDLKRAEHSPDRVVNLHLWFHTIVLDLFRPFTNSKPQPKLTTFAENDATPAKVVGASIKQLKRVIYIYRTTCHSANYSIVWQSGMLYLANYVLRNYKSNEDHFYFLLCIRGYQNLARTLPFAGGIVQGISIMAVRLGTILPEDARKIIKEIESETQLIQEYYSTYPIDLDLWETDPNAATLEKLVQDFNLEVKDPEEVQIPEGWKGDSTILDMTLL